MVDRHDLDGEWVITKRIFPPSSCAIEESCVGGTGARRLLRFSFGAKNQGLAPWVGGNPEEARDLYFFSPCHAHYHFQRFATYSLQEGRNESHRFVWR